MNTDAKFTYSIEGRPLYPHLKLTAERFPRILSTRIVDRSDKAEYFGPFLTRSGARILIDFINRTFRLRSCTIPIDGNFSVPCTQFYAKRCVAPCVKRLCSREEYLEVAEAVRLFLKDHRESFEVYVLRLIETASEKLDFERAAFLRDVLENVRRFWTTKRRDVWIDDAVDTYLVEFDAHAVKVFIVTTRKGRMMGSRVFAFENYDEPDVEQMISDVITQFYPVTAPREIRIPFDIPQRHKIASMLGDRLNQKVKISVYTGQPEQRTALIALARTKLDVELEKIKPSHSASEIKAQLKRIFGLSKTPSRIEAYDIAHISGTSGAGGMSVWANGGFLDDEYLQLLMPKAGEIATLRDFVSLRFKEPSRPLPDLMLVDGGRSQLNAVVETLKALDISIPVIAAVKPPGRHSDISHFLTSDDRRVDFNAAKPALRMLQVLRDDAHELSNAAHRQSRDMAHFYEPFGVPPLIVPIRFDDPNGQACDLRPIKTAPTSHPK